MIQNLIKRAMKFRTIALYILTLVLTAGCANAQAGQPKPVVPNFTLTTLDGKTWTVNENRGNIVILNFWATWCEPCRTEIPFLVKLRAEFNKRGVRVAGISVDDGGVELIKKFAAEYKINYPILIPDPGSPLAKTDNVPMTLLIDREGHLVEKYTGAVPENVLREDIKTLLGVAR